MNLRFRGCPFQVMTVFPAVLVFFFQVAEGQDSAPAQRSTSYKEKLEKLTATHQHAEECFARGDFVEMRADYAEFVEYLRETEEPNSSLTAGYMRVLESCDRIMKLDGDQQAELQQAFRKRCEAEKLVARNSLTNAEPLLHEAAVTFERLLGLEDTHTLDTRGLYGALLGKLKEYDKALPFQQTTVAAYERVYGGTNNAIYPNHLRNLAAIHEGLGNNEEAAAQLTKVAQIRGEVFGRLSDTHLGAWVELLRHLQDFDQYKRVEETAREVLKITGPAKNKPIVLRHHVQVLVWLAWSLRRQERHAEAVEAFGEALPVLEKLRRTSVRDLGNLYELFADSLRKAGQSEAAAKADARAAQLHLEAGLTSEFPLK
jgi:tetratricopeptide (TPR) repeat protein